VLVPINALFFKVVMQGGLIRHDRGKKKHLVLKCDADEVALTPDHATFANGVEIVETQFEIWRQQIEAVELDTGSHICNVLNAAGENAALFIEEQQRVF
jgi:hypothetical protein